MTRTGRVVVSIGVGVLVVGILLIAFVAYQLWGTGLYEEHAQSHLKSELAQQLHRQLPTSAAHLTGAQRLHLPPLQHQTALTLPDPQVNEPVGLLSIPKIGLLDAIVEGVGEAQLEQGPGHYPGTPLPGEPGNVAIAGHRTTYAHPFYNLNELGPGDSIYILTGQGFFHYKVANSQVVAPTDVAVLASVGNHSTLTLTTCNPALQRSHTVGRHRRLRSGSGKEHRARARDHDHNRSQRWHADRCHPGRFTDRVDQQHLAGGVVVGVNTHRRCRSVASLAPVTTALPVADRRHWCARRVPLLVDRVRAHQPCVAGEFLIVAIDDGHAGALTYDCL